MKAHANALDMDLSNQNTTAERRTRIHRKEDNNKDNFLQLRQWLNIIFMLGAVAGVAVYFFGDETVGTIIILVAMAFKIVECGLRMVF